MTLYSMDITAGGMSLLNACLLIALFNLSNPRWGMWISMPLWVRMTFLLPTAWFLYRGAELVTIAGDASIVGGHATWATIGSGASLATMFASLVAFVLSLTFNPRVWARINAVFKLVSCRSKALREESIIPALITPAQSRTLVMAEFPKDMAIPAFGVPDSWVPGPDAGGDGGD